MANSPQARKRARQNDKRNARNRSYRSMVRTQIKSLLKLIEAKDKDGATTAYRVAASQIDKATGKGLYKKNTAARLKSRLNNRLRAIAA